MLLRPTLEHYNVQYVTPDMSLAVQHGILTAERLPDCNRTKPLRALYRSVRAVWIILKHQPHVVISTRAAPGFMCLLVGRLLGARTLWIDSVANIEELSMCGNFSMTVAHQCWVQWEDLATGKGSRNCGSVL